MEPREKSLQLEMPPETRCSGHRRHCRPASTFCRDATEEAQKALSVTDDLVRFSIGIEQVDDIPEDIDQALKRMDGGYGAGDLCIKKEKRS